MEFGGRVDLREARPNHLSVYRRQLYGPRASRICKSGARQHHVRECTASDSRVRRTAATFARPSQRCRHGPARATSFGPFLAALRGDVSRLSAVAVAHACARAADRRTARARVHHSARLRPRLVLRLAPRQCRGRPAVQPDHADAIRELGRQHGRITATGTISTAAAAAADIYSACLTVREYLALSPLAAPALPPAAPSAGRQPAAAAAGVPAALSRAVRHAARLAAGALLGPSHQPRAARDVRHPGRAARLAGGPARPCAGDRGVVGAGRVAVLRAAPLRDGALVAARRLAASSRRRSAARRGCACRRRCSG